VKNWSRLADALRIQEGGAARPIRTANSTRRAPCCPGPNATFAGPAFEEALAWMGARVGRVAERVGYASASTFSLAFSRHVGEPLARNARSR